MTGVSASRASVAVAMQGASATPSPTGVNPRDARSFANWLATIGDDPACVDERPFADGTMRADAEAFDAAGLFAPAVPAGPRAHRDESSSPTTDSTLGTAPLVASDRPVSVTGGDPDVETLEAAIPSRAAGGIRTAAPMKQPASVNGDASVKPVSVPPSATAMRAVSSSSVEPTPVETCDMVPAVEPARDPRTFAARRGSAASLRIALGDDGGSVDVAVSGDITIDDEAALHREVGQLLARHGLVLATLRITDRGGAGGQQRERR